jgi:hypothetical protein
MEPLTQDRTCLIRAILFYLFLWILLLLGLGRPAGAVCGPVDPAGAQPEIEPNDTWMMAQPLPPGMPVYGEQGPAGDSDWFQLLLPPDQGLQAELQVDFLDARLRVWGVQAGMPVLLQENNEGGWCWGETAQFAWDPCLQLVPLEGLLIEISAVTPAGMANYRLTSYPGGAPGVPAGDCCGYTLPVVSTFPWVDTLSTAGYRDQGLNASKDIWIPVHLDQRALFTAGTCLAPTDFDTYLWLLDPDCETVITSDDNGCPTGNRSFLSRTLDAGDYLLVLEGAGAAEGTARLALTATGVNCPPPVIPPDALVEWEPNNTPFDASDWPMAVPMAGSVDPVDDLEWLHLAGLATGVVELHLEPGDWDPALELWAGTPEGPQLLLAQADTPGNCNGEQLQFDWDPCLVLVPGTTTACSEAWLVIRSSLTGSGGPWVATGSQLPSSIPLGDCASYPIPVGANPYSDSQDTASSFRDQGFGPSADVWYRLELDHAALLEADTCPAGTDFDTVIRVVGADGTTVIASNDDSPSCALGGGRSRVTCCVGAGSYFVVVEGAGSAAGVYAVRIATTPQGGSARLVIGDRGRATEPWHRWFSRESASLWLLPADACTLPQEVRFWGSANGSAWTLLGADADGSEARMATTPQGCDTGDGFRLHFDPDLLGLPPEGGPAWFAAEVLLPDGTVEWIEEQSTCQPALDPANLQVDLAHERLIHGDTLFVGVTGPGLAALSEARWSLTQKVDEWSRSVPWESQRPVSDSHCSPTAAAACLEWLDATYGTDVTCGMDGEELVRVLGNACATNVGGPGTAHSDFFSGLEDWIDACGGGYTVHRSEGSVEGMQDQGEAQGQDVIATLEWEGGGAHSVTLSSFHNIPNPNGTVTVDFMDPWTGMTEYGQFDPISGNFSGYGESGSSGTLGPVYYICPVEPEPGGGSAGGGTIGPPFVNPLPLDLPLGRWYLKLTLLTVSGQCLDLFSIVDVQAPRAPVVRLVVLSALDLLRLEWDAVPGAASYRVYRLEEPYASQRILLTEVTECEVLLPLPDGDTRGFFQVETVYPR